ncbi:MAG: outer membrane protein assembly factor BamA [Phycisphaerales bacterium]|nr:outer membrane protein assembly factor BamA [Phycisphaerales bacterium]
MACALGPSLPVLALAVVLGGGAQPLGAQTTQPAGRASGVAATASLEGLPILRVEVVGNVNTSDRLILDQVRAQPGQLYSRNQIDVDTRTIASLDRFVTVIPYVIPQEDPRTHKVRGVVVQFRVEERSVMNAVEIKGNRQFKDQELRDALVSRVNGAIDQFTIQTDIRTIQEMYRKKGFAQASVAVDPELLKKGIVRFEITEGPRAQITSILFEGNYNVKSSYLKFKIQTHTYFWVFRKGILEDDKLQQDLVTIRDIYRKKGFLDARVGYFLDYSEDKTQLTLRFSIIEGPQYKIGNINVNWVGDAIFSREEVLGDLHKFGPGSYAEGDKLEALQRRIEDKYGREGYIYRDVKIDVLYTDVPGVVDVTFTITAGTPFLVGRVIVRGNSTIQDRVIRRQVRIYPDQTYDTVLVRQTIERLKGVQIIKEVRITPTGNDPTVRDPLIEIAEGQTGKFMVGAGVSSNSGLVGQISIEQQNFDILNPPRSMGEFLRGQAWKGAGQYFQIMLAPGTEYQQYQVRFEEPYVFDSPYSFSNDMYYFTRWRESWDERRIGDVVTFGRRFGDVWGISLALRAEQVAIRRPQDANHNGITDTKYFLIDPKTGAQVGPYNDTAQEILDQQGSHFLTSIKPGVVRDTTDSRILPSSGSRTAFSWEQYGLMGGELTFSKIVVRFDKYFTLYEDLFDRKTTLAFRNEVGFDAFGDSAFYERFYAGGIGSLRGFKFRGVGPRSGPLKDPVGGDFEWVSTVEANFPIWEKILRGVVFVDVGTVESDITIRNIRSDVGFGARITVPLFGTPFPLAVDFAVPVTKGPKDETQLVSFSLGVPL